MRPKPTPVAWFLSDLLQKPFSKCRIRDDKFTLLSGICTSADAGIISLPHENYPDIPRIELFMLNPYFLSLELLVLVLFALCMRHAWRQGGLKIWELLAGVIYGLLLERATIQQLAAYEYGHFTIMVGELPLAVGVAWGTIIYSLRLFSDASSLHLWLRPVLDGLLALNIDLAMDAVAIRLGMWDWGMGLGFQYFGVPYANFWAWFWVVFSFSFGLRVLSYQAGRLRRWLAPLGAILIGLVGVTGTNHFITNVVSPDGYLPTILIALGGALWVVLWSRPRLSIREVDSLTFWVPTGFHAYFLLAGLTSGVLTHSPVLLAVSLGMALLALYLHRSTLTALLGTYGKILKLDWRPYRQSKP